LLTKVHLLFCLLVLYVNLYFRKAYQDGFGQQYNMHAAGDTEGMNCTRILKVHYQEKKELQKLHVSFKFVDTLDGAIIYIRLTT